MIGFLLFMATAMVISIVIMIRQNKSTKEIGLFVTIVLLGIAEWISIFLDKKFSPNPWIGSFFDWLGL